MGKMRPGADVWRRLVKDERFYGELYPFRLTQYMEPCTMFEE